MIDKCVYNSGNGSGWGDKSINVFNDSDDFLKEKKKTPYKIEKLGGQCEHIKDH